MTVGPEQVPNHATCQLSEGIDRPELSLVQALIRIVSGLPLRLKVLLLALTVIGVAGETLTADDRVQTPEVARVVPLLLMMTERPARHPAP